MVIRSPQPELLAKMSSVEPLLNGIAVFILATIFLFWDASRAVFVLLSLAALGFLIRYRPQLPREQRFYSWPIIAYVGATCLALAYDGFPDRGANILVSRFFLLLLAIPVASLFYASYDANRNPWSKFLVGAIVLGGLALVDILILGKYRAGAGHNEAAFGFHALAMTSVILASYHRFNRIRFGRIYFLLGLFMGICAMFLSGTRSSWLAGIGVLIVVVIFYLDRYPLYKRILVSIVLIASISVVGMSIPLVQQRVDNMIQIMTPLLKGEDLTDLDSLSARLIGWKAGWRMGKSEIWLGIGPGNVKRTLRAYGREYPELKGAETLNHIHNQFLQTFAMSGIIGLCSLMTLVLCHLWIFTKYLGRHYDNEIRSLALGGFLLLVAYLIYSFSAVPFYGKQYMLMYAFSSATIWGSLLGALRESKPKTDE